MDDKMFLILQIIHMLYNTLLQLLEGNLKLFITFYKANQLIKRVD